jgi:Asp-tRNA(Asn)/Glu-tRNA(Gln) amidotransferase A subunit family amidase
MESVNKLISIKDDAIAQRDGQIDKINVAIDRQKDEIAALRRQEAAAREVARAEAQERAIAAEQAREALRNVLSRLKDAIDNEDFGVCAGERVPDNFIELLNDATSAATGYSDGSDSKLPSGSGGD